MVLIVKFLYDEVTKPPARAIEVSVFMHEEVEVINRLLLK